MADASSRNIAWSIADSNNDEITSAMYVDDYRIMVPGERFVAAINREMQVLQMRDVFAGLQLVVGNVAAIHERSVRPVNAESYRRFFLNVPREVVERTLRATTQHYRNLPATNRILDTRRTHFPAANVLRRHEPIATDTVFFDVYAWGDIRCVQLFVGRNSYYMTVHGMTTDGDFANTLQDEIRHRGAPDQLISDRARAETSQRVGDILRNYAIDDWQSEPHYQNQNIAERFIQEAKKFSNWVKNTSGAPPEAIFYIIKYVCFIFNRTARRNLG